MSKLRIATIQYKISFLANWENYRNKICAIIKEAATNNANIIVFPEYFSMELASLFAPEIYQSLNGQLSALQGTYADFINLFSQQAVQNSVYILAGSYPVKQQDGTYHNRANFFSPEGKYDFQDKLQMTRFEKEKWLISAGKEIKIFNSEFGKIGINICYDSEFPLITRKQTEDGAKIILVPSCTDGLAGYNRVRIACQARAMENQCFVVQSALVGAAEWSQAIDINIGSSAIFTPVDCGFPENGILAIGELNQSQIIYGDIDLEQIDYVRNNGQVFNFHDWKIYSTSHSS